MSAGTAFLTVGEDLIHDLVPWNANWRAADDPYARFVGGPLTLADSASRFDTSMAWHLWIGAAASLGLINQWRCSGVLDAVLDKTAELADRLAVSRADGLEHHCSAGGRHGCRSEGSRRETRQAGVHTTAVRLSCHAYTTPEDIDRAVEVLAPLALTARGQHRTTTTS